MAPLANSLLLESIASVCKTLNQYEVDYLVVGGSAVAYYGYFRHSITMAGMPADRPDVGIWYRPTYANYFKVLRVLTALGRNVTKHQEEQNPDPRKSFFRYEFEYFTLDLLPAIRAAINFEDAFIKREVIELGGVAISFLEFEDLIADKQATARPKDINDIEQLKRKPQA